MAAYFPPTVSRYDSFEAEKERRFKIGLLKFRLFAVQVTDSTIK
jgi:hypothetical protein